MTTPNTDISDFYTSEIAESGIQLPLTKADGTSTEHWIKVAGMDSKRYRRALSKAKTAKLELLTGKRNKAEDEDAIFKIQIQMLAALVVDWSFPTDSTLENVVDFFYKAPAIGEDIDRAVGNRTLFMTGSES